MQFLEVVDGQGRKKQIPLDRPRLLIGREPSCDIHLAHPGVSRRHAQLQMTEQGRWLLQDLNSRNKVYLDNKSIQQFVLEARKPFRIVEYWLSLMDPVQETKTEAEPPEVTPESTETGLSAEPVWLEQLQMFQRGLAPLDDPDQVLEYVAKEVRRVLRPGLLAIGMHKPSGYIWEIIQGNHENPSLGGHLSEADRKIAEEHSSFHSWPDGGSAPGSNGNAPSGNIQLLIPLKGRQAIIGHIFVRNPAFNVLPRPLQRYLSLLGSYGAMAWDNLHLGQLRSAHIEFEKELHHARQIQIDLFPPTFDVDPRLDVYAVNLPSAQVSGDYYDLVRIGPDTVAFVIADAMGHGLSAALLMAAVRAALRMGLTLNLSWSEIFRGLDDLIRMARADTFVTGMIGLLNLRSRELTLVSAGHPSPSILVDSNCLAVPEVCLTRPWGLDMDSPWEVGKVSLQGHRWSIVCFTDGVVDAASRSQRASGMRQLVRYHRDHFLHSAEDLCQGLLNEFREPVGHSLGDDQTLIVLCSAEEEQGTAKRP